MALPQSFDELLGNQGDLGQRIQGTVNKLAPFTSGLTKDSNGPVVGQVLPPDKGGAPNFFKSVGTSLAHGIEAAPGVIGGALNHLLVKPFVGMVKEGYNFATAQYKLDALNKQIDQVNMQRHSATEAYYAGKMSKQDYNAQLQDQNKTLEQIGKESHDIGEKTTRQAAVQFATDSLTSIALPLSFLVGAGEAGLLGEIGEETAAKVGGYIPTIMRFAGDTGTVTRDVIAGDAAIEAGVRATPEATGLLKTGFNLLLKNPINVSLTFSMPQQIYEEAAKGKWGEAVANSALLGLGVFEGGPLGIFNKYLGKGGEAFLKAGYGETGFVDEMEKQVPGTISYLESLKNGAVDEAGSFGAVDEGKIFYHGTNDQNIKSLSDLKSGRDIGNSEVNMIYVSENPDLAKKFGDNVISGKVYGKHLDISELGNNAWDPIKVPKDLEDYTTNRLLSPRDRRVFEQQYLRGGADNRIIDATPDIHEYLKSKGYSTITVPRVASDVNGIRSETIIIDKAALTRPMGRPNVSYTEALKAWKVFQDVNLDHFNGDAKEAVNWIAEWHNMHANPLSNFTPKSLTDYWIDFKDSLVKAKQLAADGKLTIGGEKVAGAMVDRIGIGKFGSEEKYALVNALKEIKNPEQRAEAVQAMINTGYGWSQNPNIREAVLDAVNNGGEGFAKKILSIKTGNAVKVAGDAKFPRNYFPIFMSPNAKGYDTKILESIDEIKSTSAISDVLDRSVAPKAIAGSVMGFLDTLGLSPKDQNAASYIQLRRNIADNLLIKDISFAADVRGGLTDADHILSKLSAEEALHKSVFDLRQLTSSEIQKALSVDGGTANAIRTAISDAYLQIPLQVRGLGNKVQDLNSRFNPLQRVYSRTQSALRYAYNPFFSSQEIIESETIGQGLVGGKKLQLPGINAIAGFFGRDQKELDQIAIRLDKAGFFATEGGRGEFAAADIIPVSAHLRQNQRLTMAGMTQKLAEKAGVDVDTYMQQNGKELSEMLRVVVQYPKNSVLNSNIATTLNLVAFPARYNLKVVGLASRIIAQQPPMTQVVILNSIMRMHDWLNSDEGIKWQSRNAAALDVLKYFTPIGNLAQVSKVLTGNVHSFADIGSLGGLPFGIISQVLTDEGIMPGNAPYVQQSTGQVLPDYIPKTAKAQAKTALDDLLSSLFTYPGATIGLESKSSLVAGFTKKVIDANKYDSNQYQQLQAPALSGQQQHFVDIVQQTQDTQTYGAPHNAPTSNPMAIYAIPPPTVFNKLTTKHEDKAVRKPKRTYTATPPQ